MSVLCLLRSALHLNGSMAVSGSVHWLLHFDLYFSVGASSFALFLLLVLCEEMVESLAFIVSTFRLSSTCVSFFSDGTACLS